MPDTTTKSEKQAKKARGTIAKKVGEEPRKFETYWKSGKEQAGIKDEKINELAAGGKKPREPYAYAMAVALRRAQGTGSKPHKKLTKESFGDRLEEALSQISEAGLKCPKCGSSDILAGTKMMKNHCASCGNEWGEGDKPKKVKKEDATTTAGIADVAYGPKKKKRKPGDGAGRYLKKGWDLTSHESIDKISDMISEDISENNGFVIDMGESYNDNYLRPNQRERRTNVRQADGTQPPGALEDDIITEYPESDDDYRTAVNVTNPEGDTDDEEKVTRLRDEAKRRGLKGKSDLIALAQELFTPVETLFKDPEILGTINQASK